MADKNTVDVLFVKAAKEGNWDEVKRLLEQVDNIDTVDEEGNTALTWAVRHGNDEIANLIVLYRAHQSDFSGEHLDIMDIDVDSLGPIDEDSLGPIGHIDVDSLGPIDEDSLGPIGHIDVNSLGPIDMDSLGPIGHIDVNSLEPIDEDSLGPIGRIDMDSLGNIDKE